FELFCCQWNQASEKTEPRIPTFPSQHPLLLCWDVETGLTPGVSVSSCVKFLPFRGRSLTAFSGITVPSSLVEASSIAVSALTTTCSLTAPTSRLTACVTVWLTPTSNDEIRVVLKPLASTPRTYIPG